MSNPKTGQQGNTGKGDPAKGDPSQIEDTKAAVAKSGDGKADTPKGNDVKEHVHEPSFDEAVDARVKVCLDASLQDFDAKLQDLAKQAVSSALRLSGECGALPAPRPDPREDADHPDHDSVCGRCGYDHDKVAAYDAGETAKLLSAIVGAILDTTLPDLVKAAMPETAEQKAVRERESFDQTVEKQRKAAARRSKREAKQAEKAAREAAEAQAKRDAEAAKAFEAAEPFRGEVADITAKIVRGIAVDNGSAYSADHRIEVRHSQLEPDGTNGLVLTKAIELPARGREFAVKGISLLTDAGVLRIELNGQRKCGGGRAVSFPARSLVFRPAPPPKSPDSDTAE